jgi:hypothetical protein
MRPIFLAGLCWLLGFTTTTSAHDWYAGLTSCTGERCCNGLDCEAVDQRYNGQSRQLELEIGGNWYPIESSKLLSVPCPDGQAHAGFERHWRERRMTPVFRCIILPGEV